MLNATCQVEPISCGNIRPSLDPIGQSGHGDVVHTSILVMVTERGRRCYIGISLERCCIYGEKDGEEKGLLVRRNRIVVEKTKGIWVGVGLNLWTEGHIVSHDDCWMSFYLGSFVESKASLTLCSPCSPAQTIVPSQSTQFRRTCDSLTRLASHKHTH